MSERAWSEGSARSWGGTLAALSWPFHAPPNVLVFTTWKILREERPILLVSHDADDGAWQFLDGLGEPDIRDAAMVLLVNMTKLDATVMELADLPEGWVACREARGKTWVRRRRGSGI